MNMQNFSDHELVKLYQSGQDSALEELIKRHRRSIFSAIYLLVRDRSLSEDIFQESFIKIIHTLRSGNYNEEGKFSGWAVRVARNLTIDYLRKINRDTTITDSEGNDIFSYLKISEEVTHEEKLQQFKDEDKIKALIKFLPEEQRQVIIMRHWGNMSFKEIGDATGVSVNTALGRMRYALNNLRRLMIEKGVQI